MMGQAEKTARGAWGEDIPDWILALARACDARSQSRVAQMIGRSSALVNQLLGKKYQGSYQKCQALIQGHFLQGCVECPVLGKIGTHICHRWQEKAKKFVPSNPQRLRMFQACPTCPRNSKAEYERGE